MSNKKKFYASKKTKIQKSSDAEGGDHYKEEKTETIELMERVAENVYSETKDIKKALNSALSMKHLDRLGTKIENDLDDELLKTENYLHRARTGEWIKK